MGPNTIPSQYLVCRYCLKDSNSYSQVYFISDDKLVYEKMVKDTFNIQICYLRSLDKILCNKCADDFRLAAKVKQNILAVQKKLTEQSDKSTKFGSVSPKQEADSDLGFDDDAVVDTVDTECSNSPKLEIGTSGDDDNKCEIEAVDTNVQCKQVVDNIDMKTVDSLENKKTDVLLPGSRTHLDNSINKGEKEILKLEVFDVKEIINKIRSERNKEKLKRDRGEAKSIFDALRPVRSNTLKLLTNSNMCLFNSKRTKFACYSCSETYLDIRDLRQHSSRHTLNYSQIKRCRGMSYNNVDISNLTCKLCSNPCHDLTDLRDHLTDKHDVAFGTGDHLLLPFRLEEGFKCVICDESFQTFTRLSIHMNGHSTSNVCEKCGAAYTNRRSLRSHLNAVHKEQQCTQCSAIFPTHSARANHMRHAHGMGGYKRYCMKCEMTFRYTYQLAQHMIDKHGAKQQISDCEHCDKRFYNPNGLKTHVRSVHIGERNYPCSICDMRFFTTCDKKRHERTHGDEKSFSCGFCEVKFRSKDSMRRHLRKQHGSAKSAG